MTHLQAGILVVCVVAVAIIIVGRWLFNGRG